MINLFHILVEYDFIAWRRDRERDRGHLVEQAVLYKNAELIYHQPTLITVAFWKTKCDSYFWCFGSNPVIYRPYSLISNRDTYEYIILFWKLLVSQLTFCLCSKMHIYEMDNPVHPSIQQSISQFIHPSIHSPSHTRHKINSVQSIIHPPMSVCPSMSVCQTDISVLRSNMLRVWTTGNMVLRPQYWNYRR